MKGNQRNNKAKAPQEGASAIHRRTVTSILMETVQIIRKIFLKMPFTLTVLVKNELHMRNKN